MRSFISMIFVLGLMVQTVVGAVATFRVNPITTNTPAGMTNVVRAISSTNAVLWSTAEPEHVSYDFSGVDAIFMGGVTLGGNVVVQGTLTGNGSGITNLPLSAITNAYWVTNTAAANAIATAQAITVGGTITGNLAGGTNLALGVFTNATVWVDAANGDDSAARRGDPVNPYATITAGITAATSGDEVIVMPGYYTENVNISNVITLNLSDGVTVYGQMSLWTNVTVRGEGTLTNYANPVVQIWSVVDLTVKEIRQTGAAQSVVHIPQWGSPWPLSGGIIRARRITADSTLTGVIYDDGYYPETNIQVYVYVDRFEATNSPPVYTGLIAEARRQYIAPCRSQGALNEDQFPGQIVGGPILVLP